MLEADQDTHLQTPLHSVCMWEASERKSGCLCACTCMCICTNSSVCIRARIRKGKECKQETEPGRNRESLCCTDLKIDLCGKRLLCSIPRCVCACMGMQWFVKDIKSNSCQVKFWPQISLFVCCSCLTSVK